LKCRTEIGFHGGKELPRAIRGGGPFVVDRWSEQRKLFTQDGGGGSFSSVQLFVTLAIPSAAPSNEAGRKESGNITSPKRTSTSSAAAVFGRFPQARASTRWSGASATAINAPQASTPTSGAAIQKQAKTMATIANSPTTRSAQKLKDLSIFVAIAHLLVSASEACSRHCARHHQGTFKGFSLTPISTTGIPAQFLQCYGAIVGALSCFGCTMLFVQLINW
jgi:hypothetical protein